MDLLIYGMGTRQQREGIRGIPYLQQKCSQHRMDISSLVSQGMISGLEIVGWYVVIRERGNDLTATLERMAYNSPAGTWGALVDNMADATPRTDAQSFCSVPDR